MVPPRNPPRSYSRGTPSTLSSLRCARYAPPATHLGSRLTGWVPTPVAHGRRLGPYLCPTPPSTVRDSCVSLLLLPGGSLSRPYYQLKRLTSLLWPVGRTTSRGSLWAFLPVRVSSSPPTRVCF